MRAAYTRIWTSYLPSIAPGKALIHAYIDGSNYAKLILESWSPAHSLRVIIRSESELSSALEWGQVPRLCCALESRPRAGRSRDPLPTIFDSNVGTSIRRPRAKFITRASGTGSNDMSSTERPVRDAGTRFPVDRLSSQPMVFPGSRRPELNPLL